MLNVDLNVKCAPVTRNIQSYHLLIHSIFNSIFNTDIIKRILSIERDLFQIGLLRISWKIFEMISFYWQIQKCP